MPDEFRSLADLLREERSAVTPLLETVEGVEGLAADTAGAVAAARDVRLFRARVEEAVESAVATLCCDIAAEVVGRELQLAPAALTEIVRRALRRFHAESPVRVRVDPQDVSSLAALGFETVADSNLRRGDVVLEVRAGTIDASLGVRLDAVLRAYR